MGIDEDFDKSTNKFPYHFDPSEISSLILKKLVQDANDLGDNPEPVKDVVITCPAYFGTKERMQTKQAGEIAGLNVLAIINEPTAAAIAYGMKTSEKKTVLVYDLGGGTFDVTIINVNNGAIKVIATGGDHHLGGVDWDTELADFMLDNFNQQNGTSYTMEDEELKYTLLLEAETKKKQLSAKDVVKCNVQYDGKSARFEISRDIFDTLTKAHLDETIDATRKVIDIAKEKGYTNENEYEFLLVGGSSRMPQVKKRLDAEFGCDAKLSDPDQCVAKGAAIYAMNEAYSQAVEDYKTGEIDEKPAPLKGPRTRVVNVTSKTYGTDCNDDNGNTVVQNLIFANTSLPARYEMPFATAHDNQKEISMKVYESDFTSQETDQVVEERFCTMLEDRVLQITKNWPKGTSIKVVFDVNQEGILAVHASVGEEALDFSLTIKGVKSEEELSNSKMTIGKTVVS
jgi:molecular chaperone DnaK (HSP70)